MILLPACPGIGYTAICLRHISDPILALVAEEIVIPPTQDGIRRVDVPMLACESTAEDPDEAKLGGEREWAKVYDFIRRRAKEVLWPHGWEEIVIHELIRLDSEISESSRLGVQTGFLCQKVFGLLAMPSTKEIQNRRIMPPIRKGRPEAGWFL